MITKANTILKNVFGYENFRPLQKEIIEHILNRKDTLVIMPTGGGKSLCYQIPALIFDGLTVVISPLISLMKDQVEQLNELGVSAVMLNSTLSPEDYQINMAQILNNKVKLLYVAPETLMMERTIEMLSKVNVDCITVDEAHCISEWGHDFRPEYRDISNIRKQFNGAVLLGFTATATPHVQDDIIKNLELKSPKKFIASFDRKNLHIQIAAKHDPFSQTINFLEEHKNQSGIIYCFSRKQVDELYEELHARKYSVRPYHAGLSDADRAKSQELFIKDDIQIIVATIAFGMGINKPNVRFVVHYDLPKNIESYYQEIGRAGRDGLTAHCLLLFGYGDIRKINYFIDQKEEKEQRIAKMHLESLIRFAESPFCRRIPLLGYFGENYSVENCSMCDNCDSPEKDLIDITVEAQKFLSCIKRTEEFFGVMHIVDVLRGSKSAKVLGKGHDNLSTYGIGLDHSKEEWLNLSKQFIQNNLITKDINFGSLKITDLGYEVLKGKRKVKGTIEVEEILFKSKPETKVDYNKSLFEVLRSKRKEIADRSNVPPYVIFPDKTLIDMSAKYPGSVNELRNIHGIGEAKLKKYGSTFLKVLNAYYAENEITKNSGQTDKIHKKISNKSRRYKIIGEAYSAGHSVEALLKQYGIQFQTLIKHLQTYVENEEALDTLRLLELVTASADEQERVFDSFSKHGTLTLKETFEELEEAVSYDDLRVLRVCYLSNGE
ncbi:MAG: DNA helicase RecQ [Ignavibacteriae bacterium]|nr:DNA helicase RecQ [Ignavibacteriota bacterium]NOG98878.1 DNA helicase RecQ [Ignavibacteriota bacterium]